MAINVELTVLCDNHAQGELQAEHGLAFWMDAPELQLLFDTGSGQTLAQNASVSAPLREGKNAPVNTLINVTGLKTPEAILALLSNTPELTRQQLADTLNKDVRTIGRAISKLQKEGRLTRVGSDKTGHWQVTE